jgi:hypothetical protein
MDKHFGESHYSIRNLFRDEQRKILSQILSTVHDDVRNSYRVITDRYAPLLRFLADLSAPIPPALQAAFESVLNGDLRSQFDSDAVDPERVRCLLHEARQSRVPLDVDTLGYAMKGQMERRADELARAPEDLPALNRFLAAAELLPELPMETNLWRPQNLYWVLQGSALPALQKRARSGEQDAAQWVESFWRLGEKLGFRIDREGN